MQTIAARLPVLALLSALVVTSLILLSGYAIAPIASPSYAPAAGAERADTTYWDERQEALNLTPVTFNTLDEQPSTNVYERAGYNELPE